MAKNFIDHKLLEKTLKFVKMMVLYQIKIQNYLIPNIVKKKLTFGGEKSDIYLLIDIYSVSELLFHSKEIKN